MFPKGFIITANKLVLLNIYSDNMNGVTIVVCLRENEKLNMKQIMLNSTNDTFPNGE
ncbi:MAG: hypothetical protein OHK0036_01450 [Bacteroidia bacterium]